MASSCVATRVADFTLVALLNCQVMASMGYETMRVGTCEEEEDAVAHGAQHGGEALANDEGEQHVDRHVDSGAGSARLQGLDLSAADVFSRYRLKT